LNMITQKLHMDINRDRYTGATVSTANDYIGFTLQNQASAAHTTTLTLTGLAAGTYPVTVGGTSAGSVTATAGQPSTVALSVGTAATYAVAVGSGCSGATSGTDGGDGTVPHAGVCGTVDITSADRLARQLLSACRGGTLPLTVDLSGVTHLASAGVRALYQVRERLTAHKQKLTLIAAPGSSAGIVLRLVRLPYVGG